MVIVDIKSVKSPALCYLNVPQPMYVYHTKAEFDEYYSNKLGDIQVINNPADWHNFINDNEIDLNYNPNQRYIDIRNYNVWIKTVDRFIPDKANIYGEITYKLLNGEKIPTDGCYINLFFISATPTRHILFTSSGVHTIGITKWEMTAAIRENFRQESQPKGSSGERYTKRLSKLLQRRKPTSAHLRVVQSMLNPISECWLNSEKSLRMAFPQFRKEDRIKILTSQAFREALMNVLSSLFPGLRQQIREDIPPAKVTDFLLKMMEKVIEKEPSEEQIKVLEYIVENGYRENLATNYLEAENKVPASDELRQIEGHEFAHDKFLDEEYALTPEEQATKDDLNSLEGYVEKADVNDIAPDVFELKPEEKESNG